MDVTFAKEKHQPKFNRRALPLTDRPFVVCVTDPPGRPNITGLSHGQRLEEGQLKRLTCISMGGNPLADLAWFAGDRKIEDVEPTLKGRPVFVIGHF